MTYSFDLDNILVHVTYFINYRKGNETRDKQIERFQNLKWKQNNVEQKENNQLSDEEEKEFTELLNIKVPLNFDLYDIVFYNTKPINLTAIQCSFKLTPYQYRMLLDELSKLEARINKENEALHILDYVNRHCEC